MALNLQEIIPLLLTATENGKIQWNDDETKGLVQYYVEIGGKYHIRVWEWTDQDTGTDGYSASLSRTPKEEHTIDIVNSDEYNPNSGTLGQLFQAARRNANKVDEAIKEIVAELNSDGEDYAYRPRSR